MQPLTFVIISNFRSLISPYLSLSGGHNVFINFYVHFILKKQNFSQPDKLR